MEDDYGHEGPPLAVHFQTLAEQRVVAEETNSVIVLNDVRVYAEGCVLDYTAAARPTPESEPFDRADLRSLVDEYPGGAAPEFAVAVSGIALRTLTGGQAAMDGKVVTVQRILWMHPLPPAGNFSITVSWSAYGIDDVQHEMDGSRILEAAGRVRPYWASGELA